MNAVTLPAPISIPVESPPLIINNIIKPRIPAPQTAAKPFIFFIVGCFIYLQVSEKVVCYYTSNSISFFIFSNIYILKMQNKTQAQAQ